MSLFGTHTSTEQTNSLAAYLPPGDVFGASYEQGTNLRNLLIGLAAELYRVETTMNAIKYDHDPINTTQLITYWEAALGIPDSCIQIGGQTLAQRRNNVIAKFAKMNIITSSDFISLAALFGFTVTITAGKDVGVFPIPFPCWFFPSAKVARFTMIVTFPASQYVFPLAFPCNFSSPLTNIVQCLFNKLKPANVQVLYRYANS